MRLEWSEGGVKWQTAAYAVGAAQNGVKEPVAGAREGRLATEQYVEGHPQRPHVHRLAARLLPDHFRRHEAGRAHVTCGGGRGAQVIQKRFQGECSLFS